MRSAQANRGKCTTDPNVRKNNQRSEWEGALKELSQNSPAKMERNQRHQLRRQWLVDGLHKHALKFEDLKEVHDRYERLDLVPSHYNFPIFFFHREKPIFLEKIEQAQGR